MDEQPHPSEQPVLSEEPADSPNGGSTSSLGRAHRILLSLFGLFTCLLCVGLGLVMLNIVSPQVVLGQNPEVPVTGMDLTPSPFHSAPFHGAPADQTPTPGQNQGGPSMPFAQTYHDAAVDRLSLCMASFHDFFIMEELAVHQPDILKNDAWAQDVTRSVKAFQSDCEPLGSLPDAPSSYAEMDRWLKLAAGEVTQAAEIFTTALENQRSTDLRGATSHLLRFVHYAQNAQDVLNSLEERREI